MVIIYQVFNLEQEAQKEEDENGVIEKRSSKLIEALKKHGYTVLVCDETYSGVSITIIVAAELNNASSVKEDFYRSASELKLHFASGHFFHEAK